MEYTKRGAQGYIDDAAIVTTAGNARAIKAPTIKTNGGGVSAAGHKVQINSGAAAGSQFIQLAADTESDVMQELVGFEFADGDNVYAAALGLEVSQGIVSEVQHLKFVVNGDVITDASALFNEQGVTFVQQGETVEISSTSKIRRIGVIAAQNNVAASVATGAQITCTGYSNV